MRKDTHPRTGHPQHAPDAPPAEYTRPFRMLFSEAQYAALEAAAAAEATRTGHYPASVARVIRAACAAAGLFDVIPTPQKETP
jgi:hypothetical protein